MTRFRIGSWALSTVLLVCVSAPALAQSQSPAVAPRSAGVAKRLVKLDRTALKLKRDKVRLLYLSGKQHYRFGQFEAALKVYGQVYRQQAEPDLLFDMAACYARLGKMPQAFAFHRRYVDRFKKPVERLVAAARFGQVMKEILTEMRAKASTSAPATP